jgi:hypothetical protein
MIEEIGSLIDQYSRWLKDKTKLRQLDKQWVEITTPYLDRHNDYIQIYAKKENDNYLLTDDGHTIEDLEQSGCKLQTSKRQALLQMTLNGFGIKLHESALQVRTSLNDFPLRKHNLVQAILSINDMFFMAAPLVTSLFYEDVVTWLDSSDIRYSPNIKLTGKSGYDNLFDFVIPKSRHQPERILQAINHPDRNTAQAIAFSWLDTKDVRSPDSKAYALLNDSEQKVPPAVFDALKNYDVTPIKWSQRESVRQELAA